MSADFTPTLNVRVPLTPFRSCCVNMLPMDFNEAMSDYEFLCKVIAYLNDVIQNVTALGGDVTNLYNAYVQLQQFVNDYFDNLDVQNEINKKLNEMASDGTLTKLILPHIQTSYPTFVSTVEEMTDTAKIYVLSTNGHMYFYNGTTWIQTPFIYGDFPNNIQGVGSPYTLANLKALGYNQLSDLPTNFAYGLDLRHATSTDFPGMPDDAYGNFNTLYVFGCDAANKPFLGYICMAYQLNGTVVGVYTSAYYSTTSKTIWNKIDTKYDLRLYLKGAGGGYNKAKLAELGYTDRKDLPYNVAYGLDLRGVTTSDFSGMPETAYGNLCTMYVFGADTSNLPFMSYLCMVYSGAGAFIGMYGSFGFSGSATTPWATINEKVDLRLYLKGSGGGYNKASLERLGYKSVSDLPYNTVYAFDLRGVTSDDFSGMPADAYGNLSTMNVFGPDTSNKPFQSYTCIVCTPTGNVIGEYISYEYGGSAMATWQKVNLGSTITISSASELYQFLKNPKENVTIILEPNTYDLYTGLYQNDILADVVIPDTTYLRNVTILGSGSTLSLKVPQAIAQAHLASANSISVLSCQGNVNIRDLNIEAEYIRYCLHDEANLRTDIYNTTHIFENCYLNYLNGMEGLNGNVVGIGGSKGQKYVFKNCTFESGYVASMVYAHTRTYNISELNFDNCIFVENAGITNKIFLSQFTGNTIYIPVNFNETFVGQVRLGIETGGQSTVQWWVRAINSNINTILDSGATLIKNPVIINTLQP